ncbi:MAG: Gfo/Idh/MocA family oxidoreductase [Clostridium sp.]|nr:Gfo/Idh/MocA family oxidoreductase [Clostridium sp.]
MKKTAVIGYGGQGSWHCRQILQSDVVSLSGIYDLDPDKCKKAFREGIRVYETFEAVLDDAEVEIVVIAVPNDEHLKLVTAALHAGKHVICEKPAEMSAAAVERMSMAANSSGRLFTVHHSRRWDIDFLAMKKLADEGTIGNLIHIESRIHGSRGIPSDWRCQKERGGGMLLDWGVHLIDQILQIITEDPVTRVYCTMNHITGTEVDDGFGLQLFFQSGRTAYVEVGTYNFLALPRFYMQCERGCARIDVWSQKAHVAKLKAWNEKDILPVQTGAGITKTMAPRDEITLDEYDMERPVSDVHNFYRNFCRAIDGTEKQLVTHSEILRVMRVMEAAAVSAHQAQVIEVQI